MTPDDAPLTVGDAKNRIRVRLPSRKLGRLTYVPKPSGKDRRAGGRARVQLDSGHYVSVEVEQLERAPEPIETGENEGGNQA